MDADKILEELAPTLTHYAIRLVAVVVLFFVAWLLAGWARRIVLRTFEKTKLDATIAKFLGNMARWVVLIMSILACLGVFGIQTTSFAAVIGAASLAIGLAFQGSLSNLASGVMLLIFRPFRVGDVVKISGEVGKVDEIELFVTTIDTLDNRRIILPNSKVFGNTIENLTHHKTRRIDVDFGTAYDASLDETREVVEAALQALPTWIEDKPPTLALLSMGDSAILWQARVWSTTADFGINKQAVIRALKVALDDADIGIPFPQMDVHLDPPQKIAA